MKPLAFSFSLLVVLSSALRADELAHNLKTSVDPASRQTAIVEKTEAKIWPHDGSDLRPHSSAVFGKLDNGLRYVILPHRQGAARASLRMYVRVGSLMETDQQRGIAHFLEHMAFNGSRHFPAGE